MERITVEKDELVESPLWFHRRGLMQTATGYGRKLTTEWKLRYNGRLYRIYCCIFSNSGTYYICSKGKEIPVEIY